LIVTSPPPFFVKYGYIIDAYTSPCHDLNHIYPQEFK